MRSIVASSPRAVVARPLWRGRLAERDEATPRLLDIAIVDRIDPAANQVQPEAARLALLDGTGHVDVRGGRDVEGTHAILRDRNLDPAIDARHPDHDGR